MASLRPRRSKDSTSTATSTTHTQPRPPRHNVPLERPQAQYRQANAGHLRTSMTDTAERSTIGGHSVSELSTTFTMVEHPSVVVVMGCTGSGRTTFINTATGSKEPVGHGLAATTTTIRIIETYHPRDRSPVVFVDTPGWDSERGNDEEILEDIAHWLTTSDFAKLKLIGILYLHPISDVRMVRTSARSLHLLQELCGDNALNKVVFLTTMWKDVPAQRGEQRERELRERFWSRMIKLGSRVARFEDTRESAWRVIDPLFSGGGGQGMDLKLREQLRTTGGVSGTGMANVLEQQRKENARDQRAAKSWISKLFGLFFRRKKPKKTPPS